MGAPLTLTLTLYTVKLGHGYVLAPWDEVDVDGHVGHPYSCNTCTGGGMAEPVPTSILDVYKVF